MKNKFYKTTFTVTVLSEEPIQDMDIADLPRGYTEGDLVLHSVKAKETKLTGKQAADLLYDAGSQPGFFNLDDKGDLLY